MKTRKTVDRWRNPESVLRQNYEFGCDEAVERKKKTTTVMYDCRSQKNPGVRKMKCPKCMCGMTSTVRLGIEVGGRNG